MMENKKILVFCHNYIDFNWYDIVFEQLEKLFKGGLYNAATHIYYCCYANDQFQLYRFCNLIKEKDTQKKITIINHPTNDGEKETLVFMQRVCRNFTNAHLVYYHTKGVTSKIKNNLLSQENVTSWRRLMEFFIIENWDRCIEKLSNHDVCGVLYSYWSNSIIQDFYYAGNFWWTNSNYFNRLPSMEDKEGFVWCEKLITSIPHVWFNFYPMVYSGPQLYDKYYDPNDYIKTFK